MKIIETPIFTKKVNQLLNPEEYRGLQNKIITSPEVGDIIPGSGGLRKLRWSYSGKGKRGGVRIIYYWMKKNEIILLLFIYPKSVQDNLTKDQIKILRTIVEKEFK